MSMRNKVGAFLTAVILSLTLFATIASAAEYRVVKDDSLHKIGVLFDTPANKIMSDNNLSSGSIYPGQTLSVPAKIHTVKSGDTIYSIARKYNITVEAIRKANAQWNNRLEPGQKIILPGVKPTAAKTTSKAVIPYTAKEVDLLARLITAEATGQPFKAKVGVGAVVVNRVQSKEWPNSINSVINQVIGEYYQFSPVKNGYINKPASSTARKAAWTAIKGGDPSNGAMFYFDDSSTNQWMWSKPQTAYIGNMVFVK